MPQDSLKTVNETKELLFSFTLLIKFILLVGFATQVCPNPKTRVTQTFSNLKPGFKRPPKPRFSSLVFLFLILLFYRYLRQFMSTTDNLAKGGSVYHYRLLERHFAMASRHCSL